MTRALRSRSSLRTRWLDGPRLGFDTHEIHGISYSFDGTIVRGTAKATTEAGYYLLQGTLVQSEGGKSQPRQVSMKLARHTTAASLSRNRQALTCGNHSISTDFLETRGSGLASNFEQFKK